MSMCNGHEITFVKCGRVSNLLLSPLDVIKLKEVVSCELYFYDQKKMSVQPVARDKKAGKRPTSFLRKFLRFPREPPLSFLGDQRTGKAERPSFLETGANTPQLHFLTCAPPRHDQRS